MRAALPLLLAALALAPLAQGGIGTPVGEVSPSFLFRVQGTDTFLTTGTWASTGGDWYCPGRTWDVQFAMVAGARTATAYVTAVAGPDCTEVWGPLAMEGSWEQGWAPACLPGPIPCSALALGALVPGQPMHVALDGLNGLRRAGTLDTPG